MKLWKKEVKKKLNKERKAKMSGNKDDLKKAEEKLEELQKNL